MTLASGCPDAVVVIAKSLAIVLLFAVIATPVRAQVVPLPVTANQAPRGEMTTLIDGDDVAMLVSDLEKIGVIGEAWKRLLLLSRALQPDVTIDGQPGVFLQTLAPYVKYRMDLENLSLDVTIAPALLARTVVALQTNRPANIEYSHDRTGFINYSIASSGSHDIGGFGEAGFSTGHGLLYSTVSRSSGGRFLRGMTNFVVDDRDRLRRWTFGDAVAGAANSLAGAAIMTGVTVVRNFNLDPYFIRFPTATLGGTALMPSRVDVYANGVLISQQDVPPGPFELRNVQLLPGSGFTRVVVRDAFGNEQVQTQDYYYSTNVLADGLSEYIYSAGVERKAFGSRSFERGDPAFFGFHRIGLSNSLTGGGRLEASRSLISGGPTASFSTPLGDFGVSAAASDDRGSRGLASALSYSYLAKRFGFGGQLVGMSHDYATMSVRKEADRALTSAAAFASFSGRRGGVSAQYTRSAMRDSPDFSRIALTTSISVSRGMSAFLSAASVTQGRSRTPEFYAGASFSLGRSITASAGIASRGSVQTASFDVDRPVPLGTGFGYRFQSSVTDDGSRGGVAGVSYQSTFGRYDITGDPFHSNVSPTVSAAGGIVLAGGSVRLARPVQESFALVRVPGVEGVRVFASNQLVGRTDARGDLLVPNLLSYYGNPLRIEDADVPMTYQVAGVDKTVAPPYRSGAVVVFPVTQHRSITGSLTVSSAAGEVAPALGTFTLSANARSWDSPIGRGGEFYFEDLPAGSYEGTVEFREGTCRIRVTIPPGGDVDIGRVSCPATK